MKSADIVTQLAVLLPQLTDLFTDNHAVSSVTRNGTKLTVQCLETHNIEPGNVVALAGAVTVITTSDLTRSGTVGTIVTDSDHDLSNKELTPTITLSGSVEPEFNGTFQTIEVENRRTITFEMVDAGPTVATGSPIIENAESELRQYNGNYEVLQTPTESSFIIEQTDTDLLDPIGAIEMRGKPRIAATVDIVNAVDAYTKQEIDKYWLFVGLEDVSASKSRSVRSDAVDNLTAGDHFRQQVIQPFSLYVFIPSQESINAADARDQSEDLFLKLSQCVLASQFDTGLTRPRMGAVQFVLHGTYSVTPGIYIHGYNYQQIVDLQEGDTVGPALNVAFRNIVFSSAPQISDIPDEDTPLVVVNLNLDKVPL